MRIAGPLFDSDSDFALSLPAFAQQMCAAQSFCSEREGLANYQLQPALGRQPGQLGQLERVSGGSEVRCGDVPSRLLYRVRPLRSGDQPPAGCENRKAPVQDQTSGGVDHNIYALPENSGEILLLPVYRLVGSDAPGQIKLITAYRRNHGSSPELGKLDRQAADTSRAVVNQHAVPAGDPGTGKRLPGGKSGSRQSASCFKG